MRSLQAKQMRLVALALLVIAGGREAVSPACECVQFTSTFGKPAGVFSSPDFPKPYEDNIECLLLSFVARRDQIVEITFREFDVQKTHLDCLRGDYVKVFLHVERGGEVSERTAWSSVLCGELADVAPLRVYSSGHAAVVEFHTDRRPGNHSGFMGTFRFLDRRMFQTDGQKVAGSQCDHIFISSNFTLSRGRFFSPRFPSSYPRGAACNFRFRGRPRERVRIVFEEVVLQKGDVSCLEREDVVRVHDGNDKGSAVIAALCNTATQLEVLSTGPEMLVRFIADSARPGQGFRASYEFQPASTTDVGLPSHPPEPVERPLQPQPKLSMEVGPAASTAVNCDIVVTSDGGKNGSVTSPSYPQPYPPRSICRYEFQGRGKERVQLVFTDFNLYHAGEDEKDCDAVDSLNAFVHLEGRAEKIDSFCANSVPLPLMSSGPRLSLEFRGIYSSRMVRGFKALYRFTENFGITTGRQQSDYPCAFAFNSSDASNGSFSSPNYPGYYPRDTECHYFFHGRNTERVHLHFTYFDVEGVLPCEAISASDYVEFSNYMSRDRKYSRYCGQLKEFEVESDKKHFRVTFRSNDRLDGTGFHATYQFLEQDESNAMKPVRSEASNLIVSAALLLLTLLTSQC